MEFGLFRRVVVIVLFCAIAATVPAQEGSTATSQDAARSAGAPAVPVCTLEHGVNVCRHDIPTAEARAVGYTDETSTESGRLIFLLDIPSDIFTRLAADPAKNYDYRPSRNWDYRLPPPAPPQKSMLERSSHTWEPANPDWRYQPTESFEYQPTRSFSYDPDVFRRLWRANIKYDTRVVVRPIPQPGVYLIPVQRVE